jgi:dihydropteroate synthase
MQADPARLTPNTSRPTERVSRHTATLRCGAYTFSLERPLIMGVVNVTPDSFSDGGQFLDPDRAIARARELIEQGADILDVGGESTRPGAEPVPLDDELARVLPVVDALAALNVPVSVDTCKPEVMRAALHGGASMINDINALRAPGALDAVRSAECGVCLMHMQGEPRNMQEQPQYEDVVGEVRDFLAERAAACEAAGIARERLVIDPGFGFGKTKRHNLQLLRRLQSLAALGPPLLVGLSRKSTLGRITGKSVRERLSASIAAALLAVQRGASIVRVHDVAETRDALLMLRAVEDETFEL